MSKIGWNNLSSVLRYHQMPKINSPKPPNIPLVKFFPVFWCVNKTDAWVNNSGNYGEVPPEGLIAGCSISKHKCMFPECVCWAGSGARRRFSFIWFCSWNRNDFCLCLFLRFFLCSFWTLRVKVRPGPVIKPWLSQLQQHSINFIWITSLRVHCNLEVSQCKQTFTWTAASQHSCAEESAFLLYPQTFYQLLCFCFFAVCKIYELFIEQNCIA